jgi:hypothetical protein
VVRKGATILIVSEHKIYHQNSYILNSRSFHQNSTKVQNLIHIG